MQINLHSLLQSKLVKNYTATSLAVGLSQLISLLAIPFIAKLIGPEEFGLFNASITVTAVLIVLCALRIESALFIASDTEVVLVNKIFNSIMYVTCIIFYFLFVIASFVIDFDGVQNPILLMLLTFSIAHFEFTIQYNVRFGYFSQNVIMRLVRAASFPFVAFLYAVFQSLNSDSILLIFIFSHLIPLFFSRSRNIFHIVDFNNTSQFASGFSKVIKSVRIQVPTHIVRTIGANIVFLSAMLFSVDFEQVGFFALAVKLTLAPCAVFIVGVCDVFKRTLINEPKKALGQYIYLSLFLLLVSVSLILCIELASKHLINIFFDESWIVTTEYMRALYPLIFATIILSPITYVYLILDKQGLDLSWQIYNFISGSVAVYIGLQYSLLTTVWLWSSISSLNLLISALLCMHILKQRSM